ncbi:MAG: hypothetical protein GY803_17080 [Chloroflexi bacterium]|nr:hypothetical protein [Chloroflexota bacterium]
MSSTEINAWLRVGIAATKAGEREKARELLMNVLRADEENELAWLWLSGAVQTTDERRICLENVLTLNPDNQLAQRGLAQLGPAPDDATSASPLAPGMEEKTMRREYAAASPAAAILYPERQVQEVRWQEPVVEQKAAQAEYKSASSYDDVWSRDEDICAYCAHRIGLDEIKCPKCKRNLSSKRFVYEKPSSSMHVYWVLLVGLGQLFLIEAIVNVLLGPNYFVAGGYVGLMLIFWTLAAGVYLRQSWAHLGSLYMLALVLLGFLLNALVDVDLETIGLAPFDASIRRFVGSFIGGLLSFLLVFEIATAVLGLFYGIFKAGPDFEQREARLIASVTKGRRTAADYHNIARRLADQGMWAAAVLHWQRAAAQEPGQIAYSKRLGMAYARLGFYQRALDVLQSARNLSSYPPTKAELEQQIQQIKQHLASE